MTILKSLRASNFQHNEVRSPLIKNVLRWSVASHKRGPRVSAIQLLLSTMPYIIVDGLIWTLCPKPQMNILKSQFNQIYLKTTIFRTPQSIKPYPVKQPFLMQIKSNNNPFCTIEA